MAARPDIRFEIDDFLERHGTSLLKVARSHSRSAVDADDAFQRAAEKLITKRPDTTDDNEVLAWLVTVVRNEALMIHRSRSRERAVPVEQVSGDWEAVSSSPEERVVDLEAFRREREALMRIGPVQARCLLLRADGLSYDEIAAETGLSYAQVHRSLSEGRRVMRGLVSRIEDGSECRRVEPLLSKFADGEAGADERADVELHIANCAACRNELRRAGELPSAFAALLPIGAALGGAKGFANMPAFFTDLWAQLSERLAWLAPAAPSAEFVAGKKIAIVTLAAGALLVGGAGLERAVDGDGGGVRGGGAEKAGPAAAKSVKQRRGERFWPFRIPPAAGGRGAGSRGGQADDSVVPIDDGIVPDETSPEAPREDSYDDSDEDYYVDDDPQSDPPNRTPSENGGEVSQPGDVVVVE